MEINNIIWDFDGNLYNTYPVMMLAYENAMHQFGFDLTDEQIKKDYKFAKKNSLKELFERESEDKNIDFEFLYKLYKEYEKRLQNNPDFFEGADLVLKTVVDNGGKNFLITHRDNKAIDFLKKDNLDQYFTDFITSENSFKRKPNPEALLYLIDKYNLDKNTTVMVGDRDLDVLAAKNAEIKGIYFDVDSFNDSKNADFIVKKLSDIINL